MISVKNLCKTFNDLEVLKHLSTEIDTGEKVAIIGPSGSGKSTFLRCLNLLETPDSGEIWFEDRLITDPAKQKRMDPELPVLFISGEEDPVGEYGAGVRRALDSFRKAGMKRAELKLYPGDRHELVNEPDRNAVCGDILAWLKAHE